MTFLDYGDPQDYFIHNSNSKTKEKQDGKK